MPCGAAKLPGAVASGVPQRASRRAVLVEDAHAALARIADGPVALRGLALVPPQLGDVGAALAVEDDVRRPLRVGPLGQVLAVRAEDLDAVVLAVADEHAAVGGDGDAVRQVELAGPVARLAPRPLELAVRREVVHAAVAVAVGDVEIALRADRRGWSGG